jgi:Ca2+-binding RTX toxin-like protein
MPGQGAFGELLGLQGNDIMVDGALASGVPGVSLPQLVSLIYSSPDPLETLSMAVEDGELLVLPAPGATLVQGGGGDDVLASTGGVDTLEGGTGYDAAVIDRRGDAGGYLLSATGAKALLGSDGLTVSRVERVLFMGGGGADTASGAAGGDVLGGGDGADRLSGRGGDDLLFGDGGDDTLRGGDGSDELSGGNGDDLLVGGAGHDDFWQGLGSGRDTIQDFDVAEDHILVNASAGITDWAGVQAALAEVEEGVTFSHSGGSVALLRGVTLASLTSGNFLFPA